MGALTQALILENYCGRVWAITGSVAVMTIPLSTLIGGWLADILGVAPLFAGGGVFLIGVVALAWSNRHVRTARIKQQRQIAQCRRVLKSVARSHAAGCVMRRCMDDNAGAPAALPGCGVRRAGGPQRPRVSDRAHVRITAHAAVWWDRCSCPGRPLCSGVLSTIGVCAAPSATSASH
jgi:hypothetical protein